MSRKSAPKPILDDDAPNRFKTDTLTLNRVVAFLEKHREGNPVSLLPDPDKPFTYSAAHSTNVAQVLLESGKFDVEGFSVTKTGVRRAHRTRIPAVIHLYFYLSYLLRMDADTLLLLFGPQQLNDRMIYQFEPYPDTDEKLLLGRLTRFQREGDPVCTL